MSEPRPLLPFAGAVLAGAAIAVGWWLGGEPTRDALLAARYTARVSFGLFLIVYLARPCARLWPGPITRRTLRDRRWWGLAFAVAHLIHLGALIQFFRVSGEHPKLMTLIGGGFGYVLLVAMTLTSSDRAQRAMGRWWRRLHRFGIHYLWFVFAFTYFGRLFDQPDRFIQGVFGFVAAIGAGAIRLVAMRRSA